MSDWKKLALKDPNLNAKSWSLIKFGPQSLAQAFMMQALKWKYTHKYEKES